MNKPDNTALLPLPALKGESLAALLSGLKTQMRIRVSSDVAQFIDIIGVSFQLSLVNMVNTAQMQWQLSSASGIHTMQLGPAYGTPDNRVLINDSVSINITGVKIERVRALSEEDAMAEGCTSPLYVPDGCGNLLPPSGHDFNTSFPTARHWFSCMFDGEYGLGTWSCNPWVWVIEFKLAPQ